MGNMILTTLLVLLLPQGEAGEAFNTVSCCVFYILRFFQLVSCSKMEFNVYILEQTIVWNRRVCRLIIDRCKQGKANGRHVTLESKEIDDRNSCFFYIVKPSCLRVST